MPIDRLPMADAKFFLPGDISIGLYRVLIVNCVALKFQSIS
jgi:hypothetical protein